MAAAPAKVTSQVKLTTGSKAQQGAPAAKSSSRNSVPPAPQLVAIRYAIDAEVIKCPACLEVFKSPRVLPCGHSLCLECLDSLILYLDSSKDKDTFPCPVCFKLAKPKDTRVIRQKWAHQFPSNAVICRLLRNATIRNPRDDGVHKAFCEICLRNNKTRVTVCYCNNCLENLCDICLKHHEKQEENKDHDMTYFAPKDDPASFQDESRRRLRAQLSTGDKTENERHVKVEAATMPDGKVAGVNMAVAQTVTAADAVKQKIVVKLGTFNGKVTSDSATSDFRSAAFLSNNRIVFGDLANKKLKVFDISHKTRVEFIADLVIRADPIHMCSVDDNTVAVATQRSGSYHVRLFTVRDKIMHFVHKTVEGIPLDVSCLNGVVVCSILGDNALRKYRLTRAQQLDAGTIKQDRYGNDMFHHPGAMCSGVWKGIPVIYAADETEFGVTVIALDSRGDRKSSVFCEIPVPKTKSAKRSANTARLVRNRSSKALLLNKSNALNATTGKNEPSSTSQTPVRTTRKQTGQPNDRNTTERVSGHNTFRRVDEFQVIRERKEGREIERPPMPGLMTKELTVDIIKLIKEEMDPNGTVGSSVRSLCPRNSTTSESKAVERVKRPVGKVIPQSLVKTNSFTERSSASASSTFKAGSANSTVDSNSTVGTTTFKSPPKLVYRADSIDVDATGNIYVCMSSLNKVYQMSSDGVMKRDLLTEKDGLVAPKVIRFSPKNDFFLLTSLKNNKVVLYRLKQS